MVSRTQSGTFLKCLNCHSVFTLLTYKPASKGAYTLTPSSPSLESGDLYNSACHSISAPWCVHRHMVFEGTREYDWEANELDSALCCNSSGKMRLSSYYINILQLSSPGRNNHSFNCFGGKPNSALRSEYTYIERILHHFQFLHWPPHYYGP